MYGLAPTKAECLCLLLTAVGLLCSRSLSNMEQSTPKEKSFYAYKQQQKKENKNSYKNIKTYSKINTLDLDAPFLSTRSAKSQTEPQRISETEKTKKSSQDIITKQNTENFANGWYYLWQIKGIIPINANFYQIKTSTISLRADSPYSDRFGSLQIRSELPAHLLWQQPKPSVLSAYPTELAELRQDSEPFLQNLLHTAYRSKWYLRWAIPAFQQKKSYLGSYLQVGSIRAHPGSPWQSAEPFHTVCREHKIRTYHCGYPYQPAARAVFCQHRIRK